MDTNTGNKLIAEFMGVPFTDSYFNFPNKFPYNITKGYKPTSKVNMHKRVMPEHLLYNESWDWLMPVVDKILNSGGENGVVKYQKEIFTALSTVNIYHVHKAVVNFIQWLNSEQGVQASVARKADSSNAAGSIQ